MLAMCITGVVRTFRVEVVALRSMNLKIPASSSTLYLTMLFHTIAMEVSQLRTRIALLLPRLQQMVRDHFQNISVTNRAEAR